MKPRMTNWNAKDTEKTRQKALKLCEIARGQLVLQSPFVGHLGLQIEFIPVVDSRIRTIATNGKVIFIRPEWICQLPPVTRAAIIAHTIWTAALCHSFRRENMDAKRFDLASDLEVYSLLKEENVSMAIKPEFADRFAKHQTVEEIFKALPNNLSERSADADVHLYLTGQLNLPALPEQDEAEEETEFDFAAEGTDEDSKEASKGTSESVSVFGQSDGNAPQEGENLEVDAAVDVSCDPKMREIWRQRILETAQTYEMMHGLLPGAIVDVVQQFRESKTDYIQKLRRYLTMHSGGEAQWLPPARRFIWQKMYLPSRSNGALEAVLAIDTSGSTLEYRDKFFGDTLKIMRQFGKFHLTVIQCDAIITDVQEYTETSRLSKNIEAIGGGGTSFLPVFEFIEKKKLHPRVMLYFTDGYGNAPQKAPSYPVIWILTPYGTKPCDWGEVIHLDEE